MQHALVGAYDVDLTPLIERFTKRRDMVVEMLSPFTELIVPEGAFYAFPKVPEHMKMSGMEFIQHAIDQDVLVIQGDVFSAHDTHFRISYAVDERKLEHGLRVLQSMMK